ncbi:MAG: CapA family protein [Bacteroidales bacterium]|nr:CapA family protein [Bacteroidales bacterium]
MCNKRNLLFIAVLIFLSFRIHIRASEKDTTFLTLVFAGDIMGHDAQIESAYNPSLKAYNYEPTFRYIAPFIKSADIAIGNLEVTLAGPPYKGYPQFSSPDELAVAARDAGFDIFINANNHALDRGKSGFNRTHNVLDSLKIIRTGTFRDQEERNYNFPLLVEKNDIRIALLNYTYGTNGLKISLPSIINRIDTAQIRRDLNKAKLADPDYIIVTIHWGNEYERIENETQRSLADFILNQGADAIIGSHPHVVQPMREYYRNITDSSAYNLVAYSQGNFVSNQREQYRDGGILIKLTLAKTNSKTSIKKYTYLPAWVYREDKPEGSVFYVLPSQLYEQNKDFFNFSDHDDYKISRFYNNTKEHLKNSAEDNFYLNYKLSP